MKTMRTLMKREKCKKVPNRSYRPGEHNNQTENTLEEFNSRLDDMGEWISELEDKAMKLTQTKQQKEKRN